VKYFEAMAFLAEDRQELEECLVQLGRMEYPHCDMRHEALDRSQKPKRAFVAQCPMPCRERRPACAHFAQDDKGIPSISDPVSRTIGVLMCAGWESAESLDTEYQTLRGKIDKMDGEMREARCGTESGGDVPDAQDARLAAEPLITIHRGYVDSMRQFVGALIAQSQAMLHERISSIVEACDAPLSSPSGSSPMQLSSSEPTPWHMSPASGSSSPQTSLSSTI
jgi:hypothetical protein